LEKLQYNKKIEDLNRIQKKEWVSEKWKIVVPGDVSITFMCCSEWCEDVVSLRGGEHLRIPPVPLICASILETPPLNLCPHFLHFNLPSFSLSTSFQ